MLGLFLGIVGAVALLFFITFMLAQREQKIHQEIASAEIDPI